MAGAIEQDLGSFVEPAAGGDEAAFGGIVANCHAEMLRVCVAIARDPTLAEDAVCSAWAIAWRKLGSVREPDRLRQWLIAIAVNELRQSLRKRARRSRLEVAVDASRQPGGIDPATGVDALDMQRALERLDPDDRALLVLRYMAGFEAPELADALGLSPAGVRTRLKRLLDRLRQELL